MKVGFVGVGAMGGHMARHTLEAGHELAVFDVSPEALEPLVAAGARAASSPADAARGAEVVSVVVLNDEQVLSVAMGDDGIIGALDPGAVLAVHSTVTRSCQREVAAACESNGIDFLDAGISGGTHGSEAGTLMCIIGGDPDTIERARPAMSAWSSELVHCGPIGAGMAAKAGRNFVQYAQFALVHQAQAMVQAAGVDLATFAHVIRATSALDYIDGVLDRPDATTRSADELGEFAAGMLSTAEMCAKDLAVAEAVAAEVGQELPFAGSAAKGFAGSIGLDYQPG